MTNLLQSDGQEMESDDDEGGAPLTPPQDYEGQEEALVLAKRRQRERDIMERDQAHSEGIAAIGKTKRKNGEPNSDDEQAQKKRNEETKELEETRKRLKADNLAYAKMQKLDKKAKDKVLAKQGVQLKKKIEEERAREEEEKRVQIEARKEFEAKNRAEAAEQAAADLDADARAKEEARQRNQQGFVGKLFKTAQTTVASVTSVPRKVSGAVSGAVSGVVSGVVSRQAQE